MHTGSCLCGNIRFSVEGDLEAPTACHCSQCRRQSGHYFASTNVKREKLEISGEEKLAWFQSSPKVRRGFCSTCGSFLLWDPPGSEWISVAMGAFEKPTGTSLERHIFVADKGDYYELRDGLPQNAQ